MRVGEKGGFVHLSAVPVDPEEGVRLPLKLELQAKVSQRRGCWELNSGLYYTCVHS